MSDGTLHIDTADARLWFFPEQGIVHHQFLRPVAGDAFRSVLMTGLRQMREHGAVKWLSDDRANSILPAEDSAWSQDYWLPRAVQAGWQFWAMVQPINARGRVNIERLTTHVRDRCGVQTRLFTEPEEAWHWLAETKAAGKR